MTLTLQEAKSQSRCRICGETIDNNGCPKDWQDSYRKQLAPIEVILNFGEEFAHKQCLQAVESQSSTTNPDSK